MPSVPVISDDQEISREIEVCFQQKKWTPIIMGMNAMIANGSTRVESCRCMIMVIDSGFRKRFCGLITELMSLVRNCSAKSHVYLVVDNASASDFSLWMPYIAQTFMLDGGCAGLHESLDNIMQLEWRPNPVTAFVSPMQGE